jgi:hypothetical protein
MVQKTNVYNPVLGCKIVLLKTNDVANDLEKKKSTEIQRRADSQANKYYVASNRGMANGEIGRAPMCVGCVLC